MLEFWKSFCEKQSLIFLSANLLCFFEYNYRKSVNSTKLDKEDSSAFFASAHFFYLETLAQCKSSIHPIFSTQHFQNRGVLKTCLPLYPSKLASCFELNTIQKCAYKKINLSSHTDIFRVDFILQHCCSFSNYVSKCLKMISPHSAIIILLQNSFLQSINENYL